MYRHRDWQDLTTAELAAMDIQARVAVLPVAAVETHGPHLPLGTDAIINAGVLASAMALLGEDDAGRGVGLLDHLGDRLAVLLREAAAFPLDHLRETPGRPPGGVT
jgi:hypothetical protein